MKILFITNNFRPLIGGAEIFCERLAEELGRRGHEIVIITRSINHNSGIEKTPHYSIHRLPLLNIPKLKKLSFAISLYSFLIKNCSDFDIYFSFIASYSSWSALRALKKIKKKLFIGLASSTKKYFDLNQLSRSFPFKIGYLMAKDLSSHAHKFLVLNEHMISELKEWGVPSGRVEYIPNGVPIPSLQWPEQKEKFKKKVGWSNQCFMILCVGRLVPEKNYERLLKAFKRAASSHPQIQLTVLGDGECKKPLLAFLDILNLHDKVFFRGEQKNVFDYLHASDLFLLPSIAEGNSNALLEAMSLGLPCVASDIPANRVAITHEVHGLLHDPLSETDLIEKIERMILYPEFACRLGKNAAGKIRKEFSISVIADRYLNVFKTLQETV